MRMWELANFTPFPAVAGFERDAAGHSAYLVSIATSFRVDGQGRVVFDPAQLPPRQSAEFLGGDPQALLLHAPEHGLTYPGVDVILAGDAGLAPGEARRAIALRVGAMQRNAALLAPMRRDRRGRAELIRDQGAAAQPVPLDWRSGWGGPDRADNPLGLGAQGQPDEALPRLVRPDQVFAPGDSPDGLTPVSFSALPPSWPARARLAGTFDAAWQRDKAPLLPDDHDPRFGQAVQPEQVHPGPLAGGEPVTLSGMQTPAGDTDWRFQLPCLRFRLDMFHKGAWLSRPAVLQRIEIDARAGRLRLIWRGGLVLARIADDVRLRETQIHLEAVQGFVVAAPDAPQYHRFAPDPARAPHQQEARPA